MRLQLAIFSTPVGPGRYRDLARDGPDFSHHLLLCRV